jgi:hypothetical protein
MGNITPALSALGFPPTILFSMAISPKSARVSCHGNCSFCLKSAMGDDDVCCPLRDENYRRADPCLFSRAATKVYCIVWGYETPTTLLKQSLLHPPECFTEKVRGFRDGVRSSVFPKCIDHYAMFLPSSFLSKNLRLLHMVETIVGEIGRSKRTIGRGIPF